MPLALLYGACFAIPFVGLATTSLTPSPVASGDGPLANYLHLLSRPVYQEALFRTLGIALAVATASGALAVPTALALRRLPSATQGPAILVLVMPILVGPVVLALGWLAVLAAGGPLGLLLTMLGVTAPRLVPGEAGVVLALTSYGLPFATLLLLAGLLRVDPDLEAAAEVDGAGRLAVLRRVTWPLGRSALAAGMLLAALLALSSYVAPQFLGGSARPVMTTVIAQYVLATFDRPLAAASAALLVLTAAAAAVVWPRPAAYPADGGGGRRQEASARSGWLPTGWLLLVLGVVLTPLVVVGISSFSRSALFPGPPDGFSLRWYERALGEAEVWSATALSLWVAAAATGLALLVALPAAAHLARRGPAWLAGFATAPLASPQLALSLGMLTLLATLGLPSAPLGLVLAHAAYVTPIVLRALLASLERADPTVAEAAAMDGAGPIHAFMAVVLPQITGGLVGGVALAFALSFTNVPLSMFLATPRAMPLPVLMLARLETRLDPGLAALAMLTVLAVTALGLVAWRTAGPRLWL